MKLKDALKKFNFLKRLRIMDETIASLANYFGTVLKGHSDIVKTKFGSNNDIALLFAEFDINVYYPNIHKIKQEVIIDNDLANRKKLGPRSRSVPWGERKDSILESYRTQSKVIHDNDIKFKMPPGKNNLMAIPVEEAYDKLKKSTNSGLPFYAKKGEVLPIYKRNLDALIARKDPAICFTRTQESWKTRNVWGYPMADTIVEMLFYVPFLVLEKTMPYRAALLGPDDVAERMTNLLLRAQREDKILYSVDFAGFDSSVYFKYIIKAFEYVKSCFHHCYHAMLDEICLRFYTIALATPTGILRGKHGVPSGSTWTNAIDSIVQVGIALATGFISIFDCQVQGDDGVYIMSRENLRAFEQAFIHAGLKLEKSKSAISSKYISFCQNIYHIDNIDPKTGVVGGVYSVYRALNRLVYMERYVNLSKLGIRGRDYFGIRAIAIMENCKYHPLFEDLVRYVYHKEELTLDVSDDSIANYCKALGTNGVTAMFLNHQYGSQIQGIKDFETVKLIRKIKAEEEALLSA